MSHFTTIRTRINDLDVLRQTLDEMGYSWIEVPFKHGIKIELGKHLSLVPSEGNDFYEIAGNLYNARADIPGLGLDFADRLQSRYAYLKVSMELLERGYRVLSEETNEKGEVKLTVKKM